MKMIERKIVLLTRGDRDFQKIIDNHHHKYLIDIAIPQSKVAMLAEYNSTGAVIELDDSCDNIPKCKNAIIDHVMKLDDCPRFLHIIEDDVIIKSDDYIQQIEELVSLLKKPYWHNSYTNPLNTIFTKKSPRFIMSLGEKYAQGNIAQIEYTAHEANEHMVFDLSNDLMKTYRFNDQLALLYNIEFIYRLNTALPNAYRLNFNPTIPLERTDIARDFVNFSPKLDAASRYNIEDEERIMKELNVDWVPHKIIDDVIHYVEECIMTKKEG